MVQVGHLEIYCLKWPSASPNVHGIVENESNGKALFHVLTLGCFQK